MDRLKLSLAACGLAALLIGPGCRNLRPEVPPGPPYSPDGRQMPAVGFSSEAHAPSAAGAGLGQTGMPAGPAGSTGQLGIPAPGSTSNYGTPTTGGAYGPPGTSPMGTGYPSPPPVREGDPLSPSGALPAGPMTSGAATPGMMGGAPGGR